MPFQESLYQLRSNTTQPNEFIETPIFIGTASKLVTQTTGEGINVLAVSDLGGGLQFDFSKTEAHVKYWYLNGEYSVNAIDLSRKILFLTSLHEYYVINIKEAQYNCFVRSGLTNETIFSSPIVDASFNADIRNNKHLTSITLAEPIPLTLDLTQINFSVSVCNIVEEDINSTQLLLDTGGVRLNTIPQNLIRSNNVQTIISVTWKFYYDVTDFRYITLNALDLIPDEYTSNKYNKLGQAYARHKVLSTTKASLLTIPSETFENFTQAISIFNEQGNTLGYFVTPLFYNDKIAPFLKSLAASLAQDYIWSENFLSYSSLFDQQVLIDSTTNLQPVAVSSFTIEVSPVNSIVSLANNGDQIGTTQLLVTITRINFTDPITIDTGINNPGWDGFEASVNGIDVPDDNTPFELNNAPDSFIIELHGTGQGWGQFLINGWDTAAFIYGYGSNPDIKVTSNKFTITLDQGNELS